MRLARLGWCVLLLACAPEIPDGVYVCSATSECPPQMECFAGRCVRDPGDAGRPDAGPCAPQTCEQLRAECGSIDDGCGTALDCGECESAFTCGLENANVCDCAGRTQCDESECGAIDDGCGRVLDCGGCEPGSCVDSVCVCTPPTCPAGRCGVIPDPCGGPPVPCPACPTGQTCGAMVPDQCGIGVCTPRTCEDAGAECGPASDGCGGVLSCGSCVAPATCRIEATGNRCTCNPQTCAQVGAGCGAVVERCGTTLDCGDCTLPDTCGGGGTSNQCGCTAPTCAEVECGFVNNPCGPNFMCPSTCDDEERCVGNLCECTPDAYEPNDTVSSPHVSARTLMVGSQVELDAGGVHGPSDHDWIELPVAAASDPPGDTRLYDLDVQLQQVPDDVTLALEVYVLCAVSGVPPVCNAPATPVTSPSGHLGCTVAPSGPGNDSQLVVRTDCHPSKVLVHMAPNAGGGEDCAPYRLRLQLTSTVVGTI